MTTVAGHSPPAAAAKHVPAWKRLGLKLKYAKDAAAGSSAQSLATPAAVKAGSLIEQRPSYSSHPTDAVRPHKKRKALTEPPREPEAKSNSELSLLSSTNRTTSSSYNVAGADFGRPLALQTAAPKHTKFADEESAQPQTKPITRPSKTSDHQGLRKKSVTFTAETKHDDGLSASKLFKAWSEEERSASREESPSVQPSTADPSPKSTVAKVFSKSANPGSSAKKQDRKHKPEDDRDPVYVQYLELFHEDRTNWKFNKARQTDLLKNIWNIYRITPQHNEALVEYIAGLQGVAARKRLVESAESVLRRIVEAEGGELEGMESAEARKAAYSAALRRQIERFEAAGGEHSEYDEQKLEELRQEAEKGRRAEVLLRAALLGELGETEFTSSKDVTATERPFSVADVAAPIQADRVAKPVNDNGAKATKRKKRKSRTEISSDESSSSSSSSESRDKSPLGTINAQQPLNTKSAPQEISASELLLSSRPKTKIFDDELLDKMFPKKAYNGSAFRRKAGR